MLTAQLGALSAVLTYFSVSAWCRGLRAAAQSSGVSPVLPMSPGALIVRHAVVPAALAMLTCAVGLCAAWLIGGGLPLNGEKPGGSAGIPIAVLSTCTTVVIVMAVRASTALKGPIPLRMLTPIPTPVGDAAGINIVLWMLDGPILTAVIGAGLAVLWGLTMTASVSAIVAAIVVVLVFAAVWLSARVRLGRPGG